MGTSYPATYYRGTTVIFFFFLGMFTVFGVLYLYTIYMMRRNKKVHAFRIAMIDRISAAIAQDIYPEDFMWRYDEFNDISYSHMMNRFWKPLDSFYPRDPARAQK